MEKDKPHEDKIIPQYCCYGMSIDILERISKDMKFDYDLYITYDNHSGVLTQNGWTGIVGDLINGAADISIAPLVITSNRSNVIDFTVPYFYTRFRLLIAKNEMKASIGAFMEPLHWSMWLGIFVTLHITALAATFYEWHSPYGLTPNGRDRVKVFSFPSALNLCWSILFSHTVTTKTPKCWSSRWLLNVWACFSLVFLASYTANLAAFMVGEKTTSKLTGINDYKVRTYIYPIPLAPMVVSILVVRAHASNLLIIIYAGRRLSQMKPDAICIFIGPSISRGSPICSALFFKLIFKNNKFLYLYYRMLRHY
jgi:hypothetical protein